MADLGTPPSAHDGQLGAPIHVGANSSAHMANGLLSSGNGPARSVKRPRPVKSCIECRKRKLRCDRLLPCSQCQKSQRSCRYAADGDPANLSDGSDVETPERPAKRKCSTGQQYEPSTQPSPAAMDDYNSRLERLEKLILAQSPATTVDSTQRNHRLAAAPLTIRGLTVKGGLRTRFFGMNTTRVLLNLFDEAKDFMFNKNKPADIRDVFVNIQKIHKTLQEDQRKSLTPITVYVDSMTPIQKRMADILPKRSVCDQLVQVYLTASESLYRVVHIPSFMHLYNQYWEGQSPSESFLPQLLSIVCIGYRFIGYNRGDIYDREGIHVPTGSALVRAWLDSLRGKQLVEFGTLQVQALLLMAQRANSLKDQESWTQIGMAVRMAMTMGLHRDPDEFGQKISPFWAEQRRKLWFSIMELDVNVSLQCNLPTCVRDGDYTCRPPRNLNDDELFPEMKELPEAKPIDVVTDSQIQVYTASTLSLRFKVVDLVNRMDSIRDYQPILELGSELERVFEDINYMTRRASQPADLKDYRRRWTTRVILDMHCRRHLIALYRPYALSSQDTPQQLITGYLRSSMVLLCYLDDLDPQSPEYEHTWHLHHLVLKQDILQAAFSVCYYIRYISTANNSPYTPASWGSNQKPDSVEEACTRASESSILLSLPRLIRAVEEAFEDMIKRIKEIGTDLKDLVALTIVFATCQSGTQDQKHAIIKAKMRHILEAGLQSIHANEDEISSIVTAPAMTNSMPMGTMPQANGYMNSIAPPFMMTPDVPNVISDDFAMWDMEFWNPLLQNPMS